MPVKLVFNKIDRYHGGDRELLDDLVTLYTTIGYPCSMLCARTEEGLDVLREDLKGRITLLSGHSGVGKSTIINKLIPGVNLRTGDISEYHNKGMHTTCLLYTSGGLYLHLECARPDNENNEEIPQSAGFASGRPGSDDI